MRIHLSWIGIVYLLALIGPNLIWTRNRPKDFEDYPVRENVLFRSLARSGETLLTCTALIFTGNSVLPLTVRSLWLLASAVLMVLCEVFWFRYLRGEKTMESFYARFLGLPAAAAILPTAAFLLLAVYDRNLLLGISAVVMGIGNIGLHLQYHKAVLRGPGTGPEDLR